jgi:hypothetical protein
MHALSPWSLGPLSFLSAADGYQAALTFLVKFFQVLLAQVTGVGEYDARLTTRRRPNGFDHRDQLLLV